MTKGRNRTWRRLWRVALLCVVLAAALSGVAVADVVEYPVEGGKLRFNTETGEIMGCDKSVTNADIPAKINGVAVTSIGRVAFSSCRDLTSVTIPASVTSIGNGAFSGCSSLISVTIPNSVTNIEGDPFEGCSGLINVTIPASVTSIGSYAFSECTGLTAIYVDERNKSYCSVDGVLFDKSKTRLVCFPGGRGNEYTIPDSVTSIGDWAFQGCTSLTSVTIPASVTSIGDEAFYGCSGLTNVTIPASVTSIGDYAFYNCNGLTSVTIPNSVTGIGWGVFEGCSSLTSVTIPDSVTSIGWEAFRSCSSLTSVTIPASVTSIGDDAFSGCSGLTSVTIPKSVISIGWRVFYNCSSLRDVWYTGSEPQWEAIEGNGKSDLLSDTITIHYNSTGPETPPAPDALTPGGTRTISVSAADPVPCAVTLDYSGTPGLAAGTTCRILYALYGPDGKMASMEERIVTMTGDFRTELTIEAAQAGQTCRIFLLDDFAAYAPLAAMAKILFTAA